MEPIKTLKYARRFYSQKELAEYLGVCPRTVGRMESGKTEVRRAYHVAICELLRHGHSRGRNEEKFTFVDLFAGIGGLRLAFESAGGKCVFTSEWDKYAAKTYQVNFADDHEIAGDITKVPVEAIPDHDILVAGFPCQPFSIAGVSKKNALNRPHGFRDRTQGTLFFDVARIIESKSPKAFLLENVKNLRSHDRGRTFEIIMGTLEDELGYRVSYRVLDAKPFVPQHRERIVIVGVRDGETFDFDEIDIPDGKTPRLADILHPENGREPAEPPYTEGPKAEVAKKYVLTDHLWNYLQGYARKHRERGNGFGFGLVGPDDVARTLSARYYKDGSEILVRRPSGNPRRLTPRECARLMGFPDSFQIPVSDTQAYKQFGNSVAVPVFAAVAREMARQIIGLEINGVSANRMKKAFG